MMDMPCRPRTTFTVQPNGHGYSEHTASHHEMRIGFSKAGIMTDGSGRTGLLIWMYCIFCSAGYWETVPK